MASYNDAFRGVGLSPESLTQLTNAIDYFVTNEDDLDAAVEFADTQETALDDILTAVDGDVEDLADAIALRQKDATAPETVTTGAVSLAMRTSFISVTDTKAYTLADGTIEGQRKTLRVTVAAGTPDGTLTPTTFASGTSIDLDAINECVELEWHTTGGWHVVAIAGATITA